ncbi:MAG: EutN/CcmL family microcompartment protein [Acidobacteriota bacterium]|nr:EutN/CcmL family microcompartment protein [Blastocatellia bacterium]MDW8412228.1 EutN/CcmL family microcompartment protein [Acidobacteriota bacterium]
MILARVIGNVIATQKEKGLVGSKIMLVQPVGLEGEQQGSSFLALDALDAGVGDLVVVVQEGWSASTAATSVEGRAIDAAIVAVVDTIDLD